MAIAKGRLCISNKELLKLFNLDESVEIMSVSNDNGEVVEFNIVSKNPISNLTVNAPNWDNIRRVHVPVEPLLSSKERANVLGLVLCNCGNPSGKRFARGYGVYPDRKMYCADCEEEY